MIPRQIMTIALGVTLLLSLTAPVAAREEQPAPGAVPRLVKLTGVLADGEGQAWPGRLEPFSAEPLGAASGPSPAAAASCVPGPTSLCLAGQRFKVEVQWRDSQGRTGLGQAVSLTGDTGYFWFFDGENVELVLKVLDARAINGHFWVFYGALSNVEYGITVTDTLTGSVKTYSNPPGQFASVGDTRAFPAAEGPSTASVRNPDAEPSGPREGLIPLLEATGEASGAQQRGTCAPSARELCLSGGRFRVEVEWKDFQGNEGLGQAVRLTGDTGYFWFFNSANVELIVKVLDARAINGQFWVFYGALSNVEYEISITDTVTGVVKSYENPAQQFASTGDTGAFGSGHKVGVSLDTGRSVSKEITLEGGEITATGADGSSYRLVIPANAVASPVEMTLTPVTRTDGLPLSGGLAAAVQLRPEGLRLVEPAKLTITPPSSVPVSEEVTFSWRASGEEFHLYPPDLEPRNPTLTIMRLSGFGVGRGSQADQDAQQMRIPASPEDQLNQEIQALVARERRARLGAQAGLQKASALSPSDFLGDMEVALRRSYTERVLPKVDAARRRCSAIRGALIAVGTWEAFVEGFGLQQRLRAEYDALRRAVPELYARCYNESYRKCVRDKRPAEGVTMKRLYAKLTRLGAQGLVDETRIEKCLNFELSLESTISSIFFSEGNQYGWRSHVKANVPLTHILDGLYQGRGEFQYDPPIEVVGFACRVTVNPPHGELSVDPGAGSFIDHNVFEGVSQQPALIVYNVYTGGEISCDRDNGSRELNLTVAFVASYRFLELDKWDPIVAGLVADAWSPPDPLLVPLTGDAPFLSIEGEPKALEHDVWTTTGSRKMHLLHKPK